MVPCRVCPHLLTAHLCQHMSVAVANVSLGSFAYRATHGDVRAQATADLLFLIEFLSVSFS
jgi:hypothetical protein